jgi:hypothetical protein
VIVESQDLEWVCCRETSHTATADRPSWAGGNFTKNRWMILDLWSVPLKFLNPLGEMVAGRI